MKDKDGCLDQEKAFLRRLSKHPELKARFEKILDAAEGAGAQKLNAHQIEEILIEQLRELGKQSLQSWADHTAKQVEEQVADIEPTTHYGKKKG